jgi:hypothetical protein
MVYGFQVVWKEEERGWVMNHLNEPRVQSASNTGRETGKLVSCRKNPHRSSSVLFSISCTAINLVVAADTAQEL